MEAKKLGISHLDIIQMIDKFERGGSQ